MYVKVMCGQPELIKSEAGNRAAENAREWLACLTYMRHSPDMLSWPDHEGRQNCVHCKQMNVEEGLSGPRYNHLLDYYGTLPYLVIQFQSNNINYILSTMCDD